MLREMEKEPPEKDGGNHPNPSNILPLALFFHEISLD